jgi:hypothetical protein
MTMHHTTHPDDERLAAHASADREAVSDRELVAHLDGCDRCRPIVDELAILRDALALLPDIAPSRPLRLIPPVAEPAARPFGAREWLRRLAAPAMAAGVGLVLVGAVGASGITGQFAAQLSGKAAGGSTAQPESNASGVAGRPVAAPSGSPRLAPGTATDGSTYGHVSSPPRNLDSGGGASPPSSQGEGAFQPLSHSSTDQPWLTFLIAGFGLFGISAILRYSLTPRAG